MTLYRDDPDRCCALNKVEPLHAALPHKEAWVSGLRRDQSKSRSETPIVLATDRPLKVHPSPTGTPDVYRYSSFTTSPSTRSSSRATCPRAALRTRAVMPGEDERSGRWAGSEKTECGLHTFLKAK
ncbi:MAG: phosphoadenosine phosphosulfate reductase family protein [Deltaproteobacteria bacterium]|nr:phosphoadenosine phosphosulfate reductase family protein [Deltaproteobacteria bacterium]